MQDATQYWLNAKEGNWAEGIERRSGTRELAGQTVGIIGFGNIGRLVVRPLQALTSCRCCRSAAEPWPAGRRLCLCSQARRLAGFRCRLLCYDLIDLPVGRDLELDAEAVDLETLLRESSFCLATET